MELSLLTVTFTSLLWAATAATTTKTLEKKLLDIIFQAKDYDPRIRPPGINSVIEDPVFVRVNFHVKAIPEIDDAKMRYQTQLTFRMFWNDPRLQFDDHKGKIKYLTLTDSSKLWKPDLFFTNELSSTRHEMTTPNLVIRIYPDGGVLFSQRITVNLACPMEFTNYPFDRQTCSIQMSSYGYTTDDVVLMWKEGDPVQVSRNARVPNFSLERHTTDYCTSKSSNGEQYSCIVAHLHLRREVSLYVIQIFIPSLLCVLVSWIVLWLEPKAITARVVVGIGSLMSLKSIVHSINTSLPPVSYIKIIDIWTGMCVAFVFAALLETTLVHLTFIRQNRSALGKRWIRASYIDSVCRLAYPTAFGVLVFFFFADYIYTLMGEKVADSSLVAGNVTTNSMRNSSG